MWIASCVSVWTATICSVLGDSLADLRVGGQVTALFPFDEGFPLGHAVRAEGDVSELGAGIDERAPETLALDLDRDPHDIRGCGADATLDPGP